jgi:polyisoprenoid-binding protein YceI
MKLARLVFIGIAALMLAASKPLAIERYELDTARTRIGFVVRHLGITNVSGQFNRFEGTIDIDTADITRSAVRVVIDAASIDTGHERRDAHLRSGDFLDAARYPRITFVSKRVVRRAGGLSLVGDLTIRDVTREVVIPFQSNAATGDSHPPKRIVAHGSLVIDRFEYGLKYSKLAEAVAVVAPEVRILLDVEAVGTRPAAE